MTLDNWIKGKHASSEEDMILKVAELLEVTDIETSALLLSAGRKAKHLPNEVQAHINQLLQQATASTTIDAEEFEVIGEPAESHQLNTNTINTTNTQHISIQQPANSPIDNPTKPSRKRLYQGVALISLVAIVFPLVIILLPGINIIQGDNSQTGIFTSLEQHIQPTTQPTITPPAPITVALDKTTLSFEWTDFLENNKYIYGQIIVHICSTDPKTTQAYYIIADELAPNPKPIRHYTIQLLNKCQSISIAPDVTPKDIIQISLAIYDPIKEYFTKVPLYTYIVTRNMLINGLNIEAAALRQYAVPSERQPYGCTDGPQDRTTIGGVYPIGGWIEVEKTNAIETVEIWIDDTKVGNANYGAFHSEGKPKHKFIWNWDTTKFLNGEHTLKI